MRTLQLAMITLLLVGACTAEDGATGEGRRENVDPSSREDAEAPRGNASRTDATTPTSRDDATVSEPDSGEVADTDAGETTPDASEPPVADASEPPVEDAGETTPDASEPVVPDAGIKRCGTRGGIMCKPGEFCDFGGDPACGATDKGGECKPTGGACTKEYAPVCGCDKRTYSNACTANAAGVSVMRQGPCSPDECTAVGGQVLTSFGAGTPSCAPGQESWALSGGIEPVVCCLGKVKEPGGPKDPGICGGIAGFQCGKGMFCNYAKGTGCNGVADASGVCEVVNQGVACITLYDPVCGCDGKTYSNGCFATQAGMAVKYAGACQ